MWTQTEYKHAVLHGYNRLEKQADLMLSWLLCHFIAALKSFMLPDPKGLFLYKHESVFVEKITQKMMCNWVRLWKIFWGRTSSHNLLDKVEANDAMNIH